MLFVFEPDSTLGALASQSGIPLFMRGRKLASQSAAESLIAHAFGFLFCRNLYLFNVMSSMKMKKGSGFYSTPLSAKHGSMAIMR